mgnify:CR=1 FL=1
MRIFKQTYEVKRNETGYLYRDNQLKEQWNAGYYKVWDFWERTELVTLPTIEKTFTINNQEVLTSDNVALRFSFMLAYKITNGELFLNTFDISSYINNYNKMNEAETRIGNIAQLIVRNKISAVSSEDLNEKRQEITDFKTEELIKDAALFGVEIIEAKLKDITFPKMIQDLFAKQLEAKIRSKTDLENARTAVASARTLKNAADLMKENEYIKFIKYMETITKIAEKGKNTFVIGEMSKINY